MKKSNLLILFMFSFLLLSGCSNLGKKNEESAQIIDKMILDAAVKIQSSHAALYQAGALNSINVKPSSEFGQNLYSVVWYGDAIQLLAKMAKDQNMKFKYSGVRLPLPVSIKSIDANYNDTLSIIKSQIGYRAELSQSGKTMSLIFNRPNTK
jgi:defect in organelle trafficking protein DotD